MWAGISFTIKKFLFKISNNVLIDSTQFTPAGDSNRSDNSRQPRSGYQSKSFSAKEAITSWLTPLQLTPAGQFKQIKQLTPGAITLPIKSFSAKEATTSWLPPYSSRRPGDSNRSVKNTAAKNGTDDTGSTGGADESYGVEAVGVPNEAGKNSNKKCILEAKQANSVYFVPQSPHFALWCLLIHPYRAWIYRISARDLLRLPSRAEDLFEYHGNRLGLRGDLLSFYRADLYI